MHFLSFHQGPGGAQEPEAQAEEQRSDDPEPPARRQPAWDEALHSDLAWQRQRLACLSLLLQGKQHGH